MVFFYVEEQLDIVLLTISGQKAYKPSRAFTCRIPLFKLRKRRKPQGFD